MNPVACRFGRAATRYEQHAGVQRQVSERLLRLAEQQFTTPPRRILEVGCGTGLLSRPLRQMWPDAEIVCCDLAPAMVRTCRQTLMMLQPQTGTIGFAVCDGAALPFAGPFDLIISSMTAQWFPDPAASLAVWRGMLAAGGCLAVALPVAGSLAEWEAALKALGLPSGLQPFPPVADLVAALTPTHATVYEIDVFYQQGMDFLREIKGIGGETPRAGYVPLSPRHLRQAVTAFTTAGAQVSWRIAEIIAKAAA
jgi:malonyl-CoA O-methyltransferase